MEWFASRFSGLVLLLINSRSMITIGIIFLIVAAVLMLMGRPVSTAAAFGGLAYVFITLGTIVYSVVKGSDIYFS